MPPLTWTPLALKTPRTALPPLYTHPIGSLPRPQVLRDLLAQCRRIASPHPRRLRAVRHPAAGAGGPRRGQRRRVAAQPVHPRVPDPGGRLRALPALLPPGRGQSSPRWSSGGCRPASRSSPRTPASWCEHTTGVTKFALPSPFLIAVRYWHADHSRDAYPTLAALPRPPRRRSWPARPGRWSRRASTSCSSTTRP